MNDIIKKLHEKGYILEVKHYRLVETAGRLVFREASQAKKEKLKISAKGGKTEAYVTFEKNFPGKRIYLGVAFCNIADHFNKKKGFWTAVSRAFQKVGRGNLREALK